MPFSTPQFLAIALLGLIFSALGVHAEDATTNSAPSVASQIQAGSVARSARGFQLGLKAGFYEFTDSKSRAAFGGDAFSLSPSFSAAPVDTPQGRLRFDFSIQNFDDGPNQLFFVPIGVSFRKALGDGGARPYAGVGVHTAPTYIDVPGQGVNDEFKVGYGGSAFIGTQLGSRFSLEARYYLLSEVEGFDLSGAQFTAGVRF